MADEDLGPEAAALQVEMERTYVKLRDLAAATSTAPTNQMVGYAYGYGHAMLREGNLPEARKQLAWLALELGRLQSAGGGTP